MNATQRNARIGSKSILAFYCIASSIDAGSRDARHCLELYCEPAFMIGQPELWRCLSALVATSDLVSSSPVIDMIPYRLLLVHLALGVDQRNGLACWDQLITHPLSLTYRLNESNSQTRAHLYAVAWFLTLKQAVYWPYILYQLLWYTSWCTISVT